MAGFNDYPASRDGELDRVSGRSVQLLQHAPFLRQAVCRVVQGAGQVKGNGLGLTGHLRKSDSQIAAVLADRART